MRVEGDDDGRAPLGVGAFHGGIDKQPVAAVHAVENADGHDAAVRALDLAESIPNIHAHHVSSLVPRRLD